MRVKKYILIICVIVLDILLLSDSSFSNYTSYDLSKAEIQSLQTGNIIVKKYKYKTQEGEIARVVGAILIHKGVEEVWMCITDWERMPQYVDTLDYYKVLERLNHSTSVIEGQIHIAFLKFRYTLIVQNEKEKFYQQWHLLSETAKKQYNIKQPLQPHSKGIKNIEGYQYLLPIDNNTTVLYYAPIVEVTVPVPAFVENGLTQKSMKDYLYGIKKYLEQRT